MKKIIFVGVLALFASCSPKTTEVIEEKVPVTYPTAEIGQGKGLYDGKCGECHNLKKVDNYSSEAWAKILPVMAKKAKLAESETALIQEYVMWELNN